MNIFKPFLFLQLNRYYFLIHLDYLKQNYNNLIDFRI